MFARRFRKSNYQGLRIMFRYILNTFFWAIISLPAGAQLSDWDSDQDAMPNGWELFRGLDTDNPKDAWADSDNDGILNIYELYLGSNPQDPSQPVILNLTADQSLSESIVHSSRGIVLRIPKGKYDLNFEFPSDQEAPRLMIQGGWNETFTDRDSCGGTTIFEGNGQASILNFNLKRGNSAALILDGIHLKNAGLGAIYFKSSVSKVQLLLANCQLTNNDTHRTGAVVWFEDSTPTLISDLILINTELTNNLGTALKVIQNSTRTNLKVLHSTIAYNSFASNDDLQNNSGYGLDFTPASDSLMHVQFTNTILWGNGNSDIRVRTGTEPRIDFDSRRNVYGIIEEAGHTVQSPFDFSSDPLLEQNVSGFWALGQNSIALQAGEYMGFSTSFQPDIGTVRCPTNEVTPIIKLDALQSVKVFPNPVHNHLILEGPFNEITDLSITITTPIGHRVAFISEFNLLGRGNRLQIPITGLPPGTYFLLIKSGNELLPVPFVKF